MRILQLLSLPALIAVTFSLNSCSDKVDVNLVRKVGIVMSGDQVIPPKPGAWNGTLDVEYNQDTRVLYYKITWNSLSAAPISMHLHGTGAKGFNALPIQTITGFTAATAGTFSGSVFIDGVALKETDLYAGEYYIDIHTALNPIGEIRGQILF